MGYTRLLTLCESMMLHSQLRESKMISRHVMQASCLFCFCNMGQFCEQKTRCQDTVQLSDMANGPEPYTLGVNKAFNSNTL